MHSGSCKPDSRRASCVVASSRLAGTRVGGTGSRMRAMSEDNAKDGDGEVLKVPCEIYSRVVGYLRPVSAWNLAKQQEFKERKVFKQPQPAPEGE